MGEHEQYKASLDAALAKGRIRVLNGTQEKIPARFLHGPGKEVFDRDGIVRAFQDKGFDVLGRLDKSLAHLHGRTQDSIPVQEALGHVRETMGRLRQMLSDPDILRELAKKKQNFTIRVWKREPAHDLFLGDLTGCCLATNSNQHFEAMIDHLIDQGIGVSEVIDEDTGETMALAWLFLAVDEKGKPHLVVDNIEIHDDYARIEPLKEPLKEELIDYAKQLGTRVKAKSLLAGMFGYSKVSLKEYPVKSRNVQKLGGYLDDDDPYYLEALESGADGTPKKFHILEETMKPAATARNIAPAEEPLVLQSL